MSVRVRHPRAGDGPGTPPANVDVRGDIRPVDDDGTFEVDDEGWLRHFAGRYGVAPDDIVYEEDGPPDVGLSWDPNDHTVDEVEDHVGSIDGDDIAAELTAIREAEAEGKDRTTALEAIDDRLDEVQED